MSGLLTIAIPTFNRPHAVMERILEILSLPNELLQEIEVVIGDNGTDRANFDQFQNEFLQLRHIINSTNLGLGGNIESLIKNAKNRFVWLVSDDDQILSTNLNKLITLLSKSNSNLVLLSTSHKDPKSQLEIEKNVLTSLIFISACVFRTESVRSIIAGSTGVPLNPTYQQVFLGLQLIQFDNEPSFIQNEYVLDTNTKKHYNARPSFNVRIGHFLLLESQLSALGVPSKNFYALSELLDSHLLNYSALISFEFHIRREFLLFLKLTLRSSNKQIFRPRRLLVTVFAIIAFALGVLDYRFSRLFIIASFRLFKFRFAYGFKDLSSRSVNPLINEAGSLGYE